MSERKASVVLELKNRIGGPMRQLRRQVAHETAAVRRSFASVTGQVRRVGIGFTALAGVGVASLTKFTKDVADNGDRIAKFADQVGFGIEALQEYEYAAERQGISQQALNDGLAAFSKRLGEARNGSGALASYLKKSNPALLEQLTAAESLESAFTLYLQAIEATENPMVRAAGTTAAFGRANQNMSLLVRDGIENVERLRKQARELGRVFSEDTARDAETFQDSLTNVKSALGGVRNIIGGALLPAISSIMDDITRSVIDNADAIRSWAKQFAAELPGRFEQFKSLAEDFVRQIKTVVDFVGGWRNALIGVGMILAGPLITSLLGLGYALVTLGAKLKIATAAQWLFNAAATANPIGLAITAIAGVVAALAALGVGFDDVTRVVNQAVDYWTRAFSGMAESIREIWSATVEYVTDKVQSLAGIVPDWIKGAAGGTVRIVNNAKAAAGEAIGSVTSSIRGMVGGRTRENARVAPARPAHVSRPPPDPRPRTTSPPQTEQKVGGLLEIRFDHRGRPQVSNLRATGPMDIDVDAGPILLSR